MRFGISTHLYHDHRLERAHLEQIASYGFDAIELFATRSHFDYHDEAAIGVLAGWLSDTGLTLHSVHAPIWTSASGENRGETFSNAAADNVRRQAAVAETATALRIARSIPFDVLVVHLGSPAVNSRTADNTRTAAARSVVEICRLAEPFGVRVALEVIPNELSTAGSLVAMLEEDLEAPHAGICLDFGHAHLMGEVADAVETAAEHVIATHVHDNRRRKDDHLVPYRGSIDWDLALMTMQKIGYDATYMLELANASTPPEVLEDARAARQRIERTLALP